MLLQLLALLVLALALARPVATVMGQGARKVVVVLDTSASMKAQDVSPSRFEAARDRKSTRLNSSHITISYAVFCLKKKTNDNTLGRRSSRAMAALASSISSSLPASSAEIKQAQIYDTK